MEAKTEVKAVEKPTKEMVRLGALEVNATSKQVAKRLRELKATQNILKESGVQVNNIFYGYALSEHKAVLIAKATHDYQ